MRLGPIEIIIIIVVIIAIALAARIFRANRDAETQSKKSSSEVQAWQEEPRASRVRSHIKRSGIAFILAGIILILVGISILKWAFQTYMWSLIVVILGFVLLFLSKKR